MLPYVLSSNGQQVDNKNRLFQVCLWSLEWRHVAEVTATVCSVATAPWTKTSAQMNREATATDWRTRSPRRPTLFAVRTATLQRSRWRPSRAWIPRPWARPLLSQSWSSHTSGDLLHAGTSPSWLWAMNIPLSASLHSSILVGLSRPLLVLSGILDEF